MLEAILLVCLCIILAILFWPRRSPYGRDVTSNRNGQPWWRDKEPY